MIRNSLKVFSVVMMIASFNSVYCDDATLEKQLEMQEQLSMILENQSQILANQDRIMRNQDKLDQILGNQEKLDLLLNNLEKLEMLIEQSN